MYPGLHAANTPRKPAIVMGAGTSVSYQELEDRSARLAQLLSARGLRRGDNVAILAENHPRFFEVYWAAIRSGLYLTAVNWHLTPEEAAYLVVDSGSQVLISTSHLADTASALLDFIPDCELRLMMDGAAPGFETYEDAIDQFPAAPPADQSRGDVMLYSSGTTGRPKGIKRPLSGMQIDDPELKGVSTIERMLLGMDDQSVYLCPAPLYHSAGLQWSAGVHEMGATLVVMERFDPEDFLRLVERESVTHTQVVPTMLVRLLKLPAETRARYDLSSLRCVLHAAAPCPIETKRQAIEWLGPIVDEFYGATESVGMTFVKSNEWLEHPGSVGRPITGIPHVCDEDGTELRAGEIGIIYFEQERQTWEYHGDAEKTRSTRHPVHENWAALGDIGYLDDDGYLYLTDRQSFMIISGGVNIYPAEIESCLVMHPKVLDIAVFGLPDPEMGEFVQAVVQPAADVETSPELAEELREYVRERLAGYKVPRSIDFRDELPRQANGKLYKHPLRDEYRATMTDAEAAAVRSANP
jgi:acyl-CoA synthetase (AMP-forming)/AMP-acid ligase II